MAEKEGQRNEADRKACVVRVRQGEGKRGVERLAPSSKP